MNRATLRISIVTIAFLLFHGGHCLLAQRITSFPEDILQFPTELEKLVGSQLDKEDSNLPKEFQLFWLSDTLSADQKNKIFDISNHLLKKTAVNTNHFITLIKLLYLYTQQEKFQKEINTWLLGLEQYAKDERVLINWISHFLENSYALFTNKTFSINPAYEWKVSNSNFKFNFTDKLEIVFYNTNLICTNKKDSIAILNTSGTYYPTQDKWIGTGGKVTWIRSKFPVDEIFATLNKYTINTTRNEYEADSVLFTNLDYFEKPSLGKLKDKILGTTNVDNVVYPEFHTYDQRHKISNLFDGVDFDGGYYMMGSQFIGSGTRENPAVIEVSRNGEKFLRVESKTYIFRRQTVISDYARVRFLIQSDSLYHTGLGFTYNDISKEVTIAPTNLLTTQSPILSTYHNFSINFGQLQWKIGQDKMVFSAPMGSSHSRAVFESNNFFQEEEFYQLMGRDEQHPLFAVANYTRSINSREFKVEEFARYVRKSNEQTRIQVMRLAMLGYLLYEFETGDVLVLQKLYDAIRASGKFIDYDVLKFNSVVSGGANATFDLNSLEIAIKGVENVSVSDSQNVRLYPARKELILKKNRNFAFDGVVRAGLFTFYGKDFNFNYENFNILSSGIDSLLLDYQTKDIDFYGKRALQSVTSTLEVISGEIHIDKPNNKSGLVKNPDYPIFKSTEFSYVYYDDKSTFNGVYKRENFFFEIEPFTFKGISNFEYSDMNFTGTLYSADIFAPLKDTLMLRPDNSLGIRRTFPSDGFAIYKGKGKFFNSIDLSNLGLKGKGKVDYITSSISSEEMFFFPDSMTTQCNEFTIAQQETGIQYPSVKGGGNMVKWYPYKDKLLALKGEQPFSMFNDQASLTGNLNLEPMGLTGDGLIDLKKARLQSGKYEFNAMNFTTDLASVIFDIPNTQDQALAAQDLKAFVDFQSREGKFNRINESIFADFSPMMYRSHLDMFTWAMDRNELTLETPMRQKAVEMERFYVPGMPKGDSIPSGSLFYSTFAGEDSLYFFSSKAKYNLSQPNISADSVKYLLVADAMIKPYKQKVEVDAKKRVLPLKQSIILANLTQKYHRFYNASISILGRKKYTASGIIDFVDERDSLQPIAIKEIVVDAQGNTYAQASVTDPDSFRLSPQFAFTGNMEIFAQEPHWVFNGGAKPLHSCLQSKSSNVQFKAQIDPNNILIPVPTQPRNINQNFVISGSIITVDSIHLYPSFISGRKEYSDHAIVAAEGFLTYNHSRSRFLLGPQQKLVNPDTTGNLVSLAKDFCMLFSEGEVNLPVNLGQIKNSSTGSLTQNLADSSLTLDLSLALDFHFSPLSLEAMANEIAAHPGLTTTDLNRKAYQKYLFSKLAPNDAKTAINQINLFGAITQLPAGLESTITFADLRLKWDHKNTSFVSAGKIGIGTIGNVQVNKRVDGFVEILKRNTGDWMIVYLELSPDKYYVFYYARGAMQVSSHNPLFTDPIKAMKTKERRVKVKAGQIPYNFVVGTRRELQRAKDRYSQIQGLTTGSGIEDDTDEDKENEKEED